MAKSGKVRFTKSPDDKGIWFETPFHSAWLSQFKAEIPSQERHWNPTLRMWWVSTKYAKQTFQCCQEHFETVLHVPGRSVPNDPRDLYDPRNLDVEDLLGDFSDSSESRGPHKPDPPGSRRSRRPDPPHWDSYQAPPPLRPSDSLRDAYRALQLADGAPWELIKAAHKALARVYHPDRGGDLERMQVINAAYDRLRAAVGKD